MKELTIISGKGGTGKTTITGSFGVLARSKVLVDCDVDASDLYLILEPEVQSKEGFFGSQKALVDEEKCIKCGLCEDNCRFDAIVDLKINEMRCEGCGTCAYVCPEGAITLKPEKTGELFVSETRCGTMVHARLGIGAENSGRLVAHVRQKALEVAKAKDEELVIIDGAPGVGCSVIASISGVDMVLIVTEPTFSGLSDMERAVDLCTHFGIETLVCINKYDLNKENVKEIERFCYENGIEVVGRIPYDPDVTKAMVNAKTLVEYSQNTAAQSLIEIWKRIVERMSLSKSRPAKDVECLCIDEVHHADDYF